MEVNLQQYLQRFVKYRTLFYYNPTSNTNCWSESLLRGSIDKAVIIWNKAYSVYLKSRQDMDLFVLACLPTERSLPLLDTLIQSLTHMREVHVLVEVIEVTYMRSDTIAANILRHCFQQYMLNVVLIFGNFVQTLLFYSYQAFPDFQLIKKIYNESVNVFGDKLSDLHGKTIYTILDQSEPFSIAYKNALGELKVTGIVWKTLKEFTQRHNASLVLRTEPAVGRVLTVLNVEDFTRNGSVDIPTCVDFMKHEAGQGYFRYSYPLFVGSWCTMLPVETHVTARDALSKVYKTEALLFLCLLYFSYYLLPILLKLACKYLRNQRQYSKLDFNGWCTLYRLIWLQSCLFILCGYEAYVRTLIAHPMQQNSIASYDDMQKSKLLILGFRTEFFQFDIDVRIKYASVFRLTDTGYDLLHMRNTLNTTYGYTVTSVKWRMYAAMQRQYKRPLFRYSTDLCVQKIALFSFPLPENSVYRHKLNAFITKLKQSGILNSWIDSGFYDMVAAGRMPIRDFSQLTHWRPLTLADYRNVLLSLIGFYAVCLLIFATEVIIFYTDVLLSKI